MKLLKMLFFVVLCLITAAWFFVTLDILNVYHVNWDIMDKLVVWVNGLYVHTTVHDLALKAILAGGSIFLGYSVIGMIIKKIPIIGKVIMWITGIIGAISITVVIIGILLMVLV